MSMLTTYRSIIEIASAILIETFKDTEVKTSVDGFISDSVSIKADDKSVISIINTGASKLYRTNRGNIYLNASLQKKEVRKDITHLYDREAVHTKSIELQRADFLMLAKDMKERLL